MPSAEKTSGVPLKAEVIQPVDAKALEMKDENTNNGDGIKMAGNQNLSPIQQSLQLIQNKVRNLEKRKVSELNLILGIKVHSIHHFDFGIVI
jgi:hypothetical protein